MKTNKELPTLPNGLPLWKMLQYKVTGEQCRVIKINPEEINTDLNVVTYPITVDVRVIRSLMGIKVPVIIEKVSQYDLIVWNEFMNPHRTVTYKRRRDTERTVIYN